MKRITPFLLILTLFLAGCGFSPSEPAFTQSSANTSSINTTVTNTPTVITSNATSTSNATMMATVETNGVHPVIMDKLTGALVSIDQTHNEVHEGEMYSWCNVSALASGANTTILFITPNSSNGFVHIEFIVLSVFETEWMIHEAATNATANGTDVTGEVINRNQTFTDNPKSKVFLSPTGGSLGKMLCDKRWGTGRGVGGEITAANEFVLKANTEYFLIASSLANGNSVSIELVWYLQKSMY